MKNRYLLGVLLGLLSIACSSEGEIICEKADECNLLIGQSIEDCAEDVEAELNSSQLTDCATCVDEKSCSSIVGGGCNAECGVVLGGN